MQRKLEKLAGAGLLTVSWVGNRMHYQPNAQSPIYAELRGIVLKPFGLADVLRAALAPLAQRIEVAFIYGAVAKGTDTANSDIDVLLVAVDLSNRESGDRATRGHVVVGG